MSNICFLLDCLMFPLLIGLFNLQMNVALSSTGHVIIEVFILLVISWLIWLIDSFDRWLYLRNIAPAKKN